MPDYQFAKLDLSRITAVLVDGRQFTQEMSDQLADICRYLNSDYRFASIRLGTRLDPGLPDTQWFQVPVMAINDYSRFCIESLTDHVPTDFCLVFQLDGFPINRHHWDPRFLDYDYVGAPWREQESYPNRQVGNGGLSLRSKKLLDLCKAKGYTDGNEDGVICVWDREWFEKRGVTYASLEVARKFAVERPLDEQHTKEQCWGQHSHVFSPCGYNLHFPADKTDYWGGAGGPITTTLPPMSLHEIYAKYKGAAGDGDKGTLHSYIDFYAQALEPYRDQDDTIFFEIGVSKGMSMSMWAEYFDSDAALFGADIYRDTLIPADPPYEFILQDATQKEILSHLPQSLDVVIDDGSHERDHQIASYLILKDRMENNGIYMIEDIADIDNDRGHFLDLADEDTHVAILDFRKCKNRHDDVIVAIYRPRNNPEFHQLCLENGGGEVFDNSQPVTP